jgi:nitroreductase
MNPILQYHERSKHHLERYAPGPQGLDWATQPDPFRRYEDAPLFELPLIGAGELPPTWDEVRAGTMATQPMNRDTVAGLFELSFGISAWKSYGGNRWALRCNPSSGNLHPTEATLICPALEKLPAGVLHYRPDVHGLEQRNAATFAWNDGLFVALSGIAWREAWKYGLRAFRYCQHDCGHALGALAYAAAIFGWPARRIEWADADIAMACGLDRADEFPPGEPETPESIVWIGHGEPPSASEVLSMLATSSWNGIANRLSPQHRDWPDVPQILAATIAPALADDEALPDSTARPAAGMSNAIGIHPGTNVPPGRSQPAARPASRLIRQRRSAQAFDGFTAMSASHFFDALDALLPRPGARPWSIWPEPPAVHPILFVHRVEGVAPGIYALPRSEPALETLRAAMGGDGAPWLWERVAAAPLGLPLYLLAPLDVRTFAATSSCHQDIASDSAFMVAMLARFDDVQAHPWRYRRRFQEAGLIGQALYLEAEAIGLQGTGIGCYFDDVVHRVLHLDTTRFQDLYHFTVGRALVDQRLDTESGYGQLVDRPRNRAFAAP